ncbi:MAG: LPS-assembly protein LptD [Bacteroidales bacterium]|nr:LPS-assembly protein LptD [Bacteroidales bacterium]
MRKILLIVCAALAALCLTAKPGRFRQPTGNALPGDSSVPEAKALRPAADTLKEAAQRDTVIEIDWPDIVRPADAADSLRASVALPDSLAADSLTADSLAADTAKAQPRKPGIDSPVEYSAQDSIVYDANTGFATLYGKANVKYQDMTLDAAKITMCLDSNLVHAVGLRDTAGVYTEKAVYKQGSDEYESETMAFNFKTKKGFISNVNTTQGNGFLQSSESKRTDDGTLYLRHAKYTTCDAKHPHFYLKLSRGKVRPGKETIFGPAYLVVEDVPLPLAVPYGFFPINKKYSSGFVMPSYGDELSRGFYLRDGGYYWAVNDYFDLKALGEIYTKGSWGASLESNYNKRYRFRGNVYFSFLRTVEGEKNMPDYSVTKSLKIQWTHTKDSKANPNTSFSARVNFASENYERKNLESMYNPLSYTQSTRTSAVSFSKNFPDIGLSISASGNLTQNVRDSSIAVTLPDLSISLSRFYPFRRKKQVGKERWYEKISVSYTGQLSNSITTKESLLFKSNLIKDWRNGMTHRVPIDATFQLFKYINISPSISFRDIMYAQRINRSWDAEKQQELRDTTYGFYNLYDWNLGVSANTTLYGMYKPLLRLFHGKVIAIRHVFKPSVSFSYAPDFTAARYGYTKTYDRIDQNGTVTPVKYSPYSGGLYGYPSGTKQGLVTMSVSNNLEMKVKSDRDSTGEKKISLIDELSGTLSYNLAAKERPWSDLSTRLRLRLTQKYTFSLSASFATYAYKFNENGQVVQGDRTEWSYGRFGRFQGMSQSLSYTFNNQTFKKLFDFLTGKKSANSAKKEGDDKDEDEEKDGEDANVDPELRQARNGGAKKKEKAKTDADGYMAFSMPWSVTVSYGISMYEDRSKEINVRRMRYPFSFTQTLNFSGYLRISDGWNISFSSGYDFVQKKISMTTASLARDLHCFEMSASVVLKPYSSFNFTFRARASELADALKWEKRSAYSSNIDWY